MLSGFTPIIMDKIDSTSDFKALSQDVQMASELV